MTSHEMSWNGAIHSAFSGFMDIPFQRDITDYKVAHAGMSDDIDLANTSSRTLGKLRLVPSNIQPKMIDANGTRTNTANAYVHRSSSPNLTILTHTTVSKVLIENGEAVGVEVYPSAPGSGSRSPRVIKARKQVVLSCGALGTPGLLERSGVGAPDVLQKAGVDVKVDLPGVGKGLDDHQVGDGLNSH